MTTRLRVVTDPAALKPTSSLEMLGWLGRRVPSPPSLNGPYPPDRERLSADGN